MVNKKFWLGMLVILLVFGLTVVGLTSCDDDLWSQEDSFTMTGSEFGKYDVVNYSYTLENWSNYDVKITIDDVTQTIKRGRTLEPTVFFIYNSSKTITVTYSPSNRVKYKSVADYTGGSYGTSDNHFQFWDR